MKKKKFEKKLFEERWKEIKQEPLLVGVIISNENSHCLHAWLGKILFMDAEYQCVIFENSDTIEHYKRLKCLLQNNPNIIVKRGKTGQRSIMNKIVDNRNEVLKYTRKYTGYKWVVMIDSDVLPPTNAFKDLMKHDKDVCATVCYVADHQSPTGLRVAWNFKREDMKSKIVETWMRERKPRLIEIAQSGLGCVMFKANILRKHKDITFYNRKERGKPNFLNEDLTFSQQLVDKGYKIWLDIELDCDHKIKGRL